MKGKLIKMLSIATILSMGAGKVALATEFFDQSINQRYEVQTEEERIQGEKKEKEADEYVKAKRKLRGTGGKKSNNVGTMTQENGYYCGPTAARNAIYGYKSTNVPTPKTLAPQLGTTTNGTGFESRWVTVMNKYAPGNNYQLKWADSNWAWRLNNNVIWTVDKGYNVIANLNHGKTSTPIHSVYANGIAHYVTIYGYDDVNKKYQVSDSINNKSVPYKYSTNYRNMENSTKQRGIIW